MELGADMCLDLTPFAGLALELSYREFEQRFYTTGKGPQTEKEESKSAKFHKKGSQMPVIASECPGWVCYAEKRVGEMAVEHMSHVKSPQ